MDRKAHEEFSAQLDKEPPPVTVEAILATLEQFQENALTIMQRGVALAFSSLDRRFRSHDGFKIGSRIILTHMVSEFGLAQDRTTQTLRDVERAFFTVAGQRQPENYGGIVGLVRGACGSFLGRKQYIVETEFLRVKGYKNGNAHLWFKRDDLVERVNLILADYYGETLGAGPDAAEPTHTRSTAVARNMGYFPTPAPVVNMLLEAGRTPLTGYRDEPVKALDILEPSAGDGAIANPLRKAGHRVTCIELHPGRCDELAWLGHKVTRCDFLTTSPAVTGLFDRVLMNPPFDRGLDMDHVKHAFQFLKPGGVLAAVMSAGTAYREDAKTVAFRAWCEKFRVNDYRDAFDDLPPGSFKESGTMVNACIVALRVPQ
jgi:predicted RNA methylase